MTAELDRLDVHSGDVLILRGTEGMEGMHRLAQDVRRALYARNLDDVLILVLAPDTELAAVDEGAMAEAGWVRASMASQPLKE